MTEVITIGLDIAKNVFQVHGIDVGGAVLIRRQLRRSQVLPFFRKAAPWLVGIEACATSHHWAREITALGHEVRLMPARYVKGYVKRNKNDAADAEAICEAGNRYLRWLLVAGSMSLIRRAKQAGHTRHAWLVRILERRPTKVAAIALANKIARMIWAMMVRGTRYKEPVPQTV